MSSRLRLLGFVMLCLLIAGCADKRISKANYDKLTDKMTLKDVEALLGPGEKQAGGDGSNVAAQAGVAVGDFGMGGGSSKPTTDEYVWESMNKKITITFTKDGKMLRKSSSGL